MTSAPLKSVIVFEVLFLVTSAHALLSDADHYWPLNELGYSYVYDWSKLDRWNGKVLGDAEVTWFPPHIALDLYGEDAWVDLGLRFNSCYVDVKYCNQTGLTIAFWVAFHEANTTQGLIGFGSGDCGLSIVRTNDGEINATIRSLELRKTWSVASVNASLFQNTWHHVTLTWNSTGNVYLFINGTRLGDTRIEVIANVSCPDVKCACDWSMKVGSITQSNPGVHSKFPIKLAMLVLWHYSLSSETILQLSENVQGIYFSNKGCYGSWIASLQFCYHIEPAWKLTWYEAREKCDSYLANLLSIGSKEEFEFLENAFKNKKISSCLHIGLQKNSGSSEPSWVDGNVWKFSKLNSSLEQNNETETCVHRALDRLWYYSNCSAKCGFVCKKYRGGLFKNAEFHCQVRRYNQQLVKHRLAIRWVQDELSCAIDCLIYGSGCKSYNYKQNNQQPSSGQNFCELSATNQEHHPRNLIRSIGFQYCERVS